MAIQSRFMPFAHSAQISSCNQRAGARKGYDTADAWYQVSTPRLPLSGTMGINPAQRPALAAQKHLDQGNDCAFVHGMVPLVSRFLVAGLKVRALAAAGTGTTGTGGGQAAKPATLT